ncbi:unnamed protein product [marine sediment metagenome]|uniref:Uncharacterized protein n=1 Tax=marine sediment metagenome TaxID=412755 RepID=X1C2E6_9ZZZZ
MYINKVVNAFVVCAVILLGVLTITPSTCGASTLHVGEEQTYQSIKEAIDNASDGEL